MQPKRYKKYSFLIKMSKIVIFDIFLFIYSYMQWNKSEIEKLKKFDGKIFSINDIEKSFTNRKYVKIFKKAKELNIKWKIEDKNKKLNLFLNKVKDNKLDEFFDYSKVDYKNNKTKIEIKCKKHDYLFKQTPYEHLLGHLGCLYCSDNKMNTTLFIQKSKEIHGDLYDYSQVVYINSKNKVKIKCQKHGIFLQSPYLHLQSHKCPYCRLEYGEKFIKKSKEKFINMYDYSLVNYINAHTKIKIICPEHGIFQQTPNNHLKGTGCPICKKSKGENLLISIFKILNINFEYQKVFEGCKNKKYLPFDFYLTDYNCCIEYDGRQHYHLIEYWGGEDKLKYTQKNDNIKNEYCRKNDINLYRIKYDDTYNEIKNQIKKITKLL